jgi:type II secretory pathway pseudopilin PulG
MLILIKENMKKCSLILIIVLLISVSPSFGQTTVQEKTKAELEKEVQIQQTIDQQKKAMAEQKKAQAEKEAAAADLKAAVEDANRNIDVRVDSPNRGGNGVRAVNPRGSRPFINSEAYSFTYPGSDAPFGHFGGSDSERTTWDFYRSLKENTFSRDYTFDVDKTIKNVMMSVMGDCKNGEIRIKIVMPNGKSYSDILIDESGNLNWRKTFVISETENQDKFGAWKFQITSTKATGFFKISLQTF